MVPVTILIPNGRRGNKQMETDHPPVPPSIVLMMGLDPRKCPIFKGKIKITLIGEFEPFYLQSTDFQQR